MVKTKVSKLDSCTRSIEIEVPPEKVKEKFTQVLDRLASQLRVPGFRPGKAPVNLLEKHHGALIRQEVLSDLIPDSYQEALKQEGLSVVDEPHIDDVKLAETLTYRVKVEVEPEVELCGYTGIEANRPDIEVKQEEVEKELAGLNKGRPDALAIDDRFARGLGYKTLEELKKSLEMRLWLWKEEQAKRKLEDDISQWLLRHCKLQLPTSLLKKEREQMWEKARASLRSQGLSEEEIEKKKASLSEEIEGEVTRRLKMYFILAQIAKRENIAYQSSQELISRVMEFLFKNAKWQ